MAINTYNDPTEIVWYTNLSGQKESRLQSNQTYVITNNFFTLIGIPDLFNKVNIISINTTPNATTLSESPLGSALLSDNFTVDYGLGRVYLSSLYDGKTATISTWYSRGYIKYPASRIYLEDSAGNWNSTNLEDFATEVATKMGTDVGVVQDELTAHKTTDILGNVHPATKIEYSTGVSIKTQHDTDIGNLQTQINNLGNTFATDVELITAINQTIENLSSDINDETWTNTTENTSLATVTNGSAIVTISSGIFPSNINGYKFKIGMLAENPVSGDIVEYEILTRDSNTQLTLTMIGQLLVQILKLNY
jgi:hypothetical protein